MKELKSFFVLLQPKLKEHGKKKHRKQYIRPSAATGTRRGKSCVGSTHERPRRLRRGV